VSGADGAAALLRWLRNARQRGNLFVVGCCAKPSEVHPRVRRWFDDEYEVQVPSSSEHRSILRALLERLITHDSTTEAGEREHAMTKVNTIATVRAFSLCRCYCQSARKIITYRVKKCAGYRAAVH
jgi:AAA+ superfamily predicted ATPase